MVVAILGAGFLIRIGLQYLSKKQSIIDDYGNICSKSYKCISQEEYANCSWFYDKNGLFL
jgi:hypothetical protein